MLCHAKSTGDKKEDIFRLNQGSFFLAGVPFRTNTLLNREHGNYENYF